MKSIATRPEFAQLTEDDIEEVLNKLEALDENELGAANNPVLMEIERLIAAYSARFEELCNENGDVPAELVTFEPEKAIESVAYDIFSDALYESLSQEDEDE